jgi:hypothetical protein
MNGLLVLVTAAALSACVLGAAFLLLYQADKAVKQSGR